MVDGPTGGVPTYGYQKTTDTLGVGLDKTTKAAEEALNKVKDNPDDMAAMMELQMALGQKSMYAQLQSNVIKNIIETMNALARNIQ